MNLTEGKKNCGRGIRQKGRKRRGGGIQQTGREKNAEDESYRNSEKGK
jgi:hypothetical protein